VERLGKFYRYVRALAVRGESPLKGFA